MAARRILTWPNKLLRQKSALADPISENTKELCRDLLDTINVNFALGAAAPQINEFKQICLIKQEHIPSFEKNFDDCVALLNPTVKIVDSKIVDSQESCLSLPGLVETVKRNYGIEIDYTDLSNKRNTVTVFGREACILQHEIDHLSGNLFIDRLPKVKKMLFDKKMKKVFSEKRKQNRPSKEKMSKIKSSITRKKNRAKRKKNKKNS